MNKTPSQADPFLTEVLRNQFASICEEMSFTIWKSSRSAVVREILDYSSAVFDANGINISQSSRIPIHLNSMTYCLREVNSNHISFDNWQDGRIILVNDPYCGGQHLPDLQLFAPVIYEGRRVAIVGALCHHIDVGGGAAGSYHATASEIFHEGLRIPPVLIRDNHKLNEDHLRLILCNVREPEKVRGDLLSQIAAIDVGVRGMERAFRKYGIESVNSAITRILDSSEMRMRDHISRMPNAASSFVDFLDGDGHTEDPIRICANIRIEGDEIFVNFDGSADQVTGPVNCTHAVCRSAVCYAISSIIGEEIEANEGSFRPIHVSAPEGCVVSCKFPAPVAGRMASAHRIVNAVHGALAKITENTVSAAYYGVSYVYAVDLKNASNENNGIYFEIEVGGAGASPYRDGTNAISCGVHNLSNTPIEMIEREHSVTFTRYSIADNSAGLGQFRGGLGLIREWRMEAEEGVFSANLDRFVTAPFGIAGGEDGKVGSLTLMRDGKKTELPSKLSNFALQKGDVIRLQTSGGGGYGDFPNRDPVALKSDRKNGYVYSSSASDQ